MAFTDLPAYLYPTVGLQTPGEVVDANFGQVSGRAGYWAPTFWGPLRRLNGYKAMISDPSLHLILT